MQVPGLVGREVSLKQVTVHFIHPAAGNNFNGMFGYAMAFFVVPGNDDFFKPQFFGLCYALLDPVYGTDLTVEADFSGKTNLLRQGNIFIRGKQCADDGKVDGWVFYF